MQGVRQAEAQLGETACVIGLGLVGQLVVRLLVAAGVKVVGLDVRRRTGAALAEKAGAVACRRARPRRASAAVAQALAELTGGAGADHVLLAAGGASNGPVEVAARLARDRARIVDIGKTRLDLPWNAYYDKELDVRFSRSYGPGRYDDRYELEGIDYPAGYVRWTERRNLACFLDLIARKASSTSASLVSGIFPLTKADDRSTPTWRPARWPRRSGCCSSTRTGRGREPPRGQPAGARRPPGRAPAGGRRASWRVGFIGAGNYATSMLLPHLAKLDTRPAGARGHQPRRCRRSTPSAVRLRPPRPPRTPC